MFRAFYPSLHRSFTAKSDLPHRRRFVKHLLDSPYCLPGALFVFDQGEADVVVAVVAEADAGGDGYFRFRQQELGELERA